MENKTCPNCGQTFATGVTKKKWCSPRCAKSGRTKASRQRLSPETKREQNRRHLMNKWGSYAERARHYRREWRRTWGSCGSGNLSLAKKAEELAGLYILPKEGFQDIYWINRDHETTFIGDFLARKDGQVYLVNITTNYMKRIRRMTSQIVDYIGVRYLFVFVKPDLSGYAIKEARRGQSLIGVYMVERRPLKEIAVR